MSFRELVERKKKRRTERVEETQMMKETVPDQV
jgi:hypothetical protein